MSPHVLLVSRDAMLLQTRQLILGAFFSAKTAGRLREAEEMILTYPFDLIILCYTLLTPAGNPPEDPGIGDAMMTEAAPYYLLKKSAEMLGVDIRAKASLVEV